jgi:hypothetical protein
MKHGPIGGAVSDRTLHLLLAVVCVATGHLRCNLLHRAQQDFLYQHARRLREGIDQRLRHILPVIASNCAKRFSIASATLAPNSVRTAPGSITATRICAGDRLGMGPFSSSTIPNQTGTGERGVPTAPLVLRDLSGVNRPPLGAIGWC